MTIDPRSTGSATEKDVADYVSAQATLVSPSTTGATAASRYVGATTTGIPTTGTFAVGDHVIAQTEGRVYVCTTAGSPGTWVDAAMDQVLKNTGQSLLSWNFNPNAIAGNNAATSQVLFAIGIPTIAGQPYLGLKLVVQTAGTSTAPTGFFVGLATQNTGIGSAGTMLAQSDTLAASASLTATGVKLFPFNATYTETVTTMRVALILQNGTFAGTNCTFAKTSAGSTFNTVTGNLVLVGTAGTSITALQANGQAVASNYASTSSQAFWVGLY